MASTKAKWQDTDVDCLGSILNISAVGRRLYLDTHINPSAGCLLVVSRDLKLEASLYGWLLRPIGEDQILYERSQIHFAPVHPAELAIHDLRTHSDRTIFPLKPFQAIRNARVAQLRRFYGDHPDWCNRNDDPCDPEYFDSFLAGEVAANDERDVLAFSISYEQEQVFSGSPQKPSGPARVIYVYRRIGDPRNVEYRELLPSEAQARFGDATLQKLLQPETLEKIFQTPATVEASR